MRVSIHLQNIPPGWPDFIEVEGKRKAMALAGDLHRLLSNPLHSFDAGLYDAGRDGDPPFATLGNYDPDW